MSTEHDYVCGQDADLEARERARYDVAALVRPTNPAWSMPAAGKGKEPPADPDLGCPAGEASAYIAGLAIGRRSAVRELLAAIDSAVAPLMLEATPATRAAAKAVADVRAMVAKMGERT